MKVALKLNIQKIKIMVSGSITSWQINEEIMETVTDFFLGGRGRESRQPHLTHAHRAPPPGLRSLQQHLWVQGPVLAALLLLLLLLLSRFSRVKSLQSCPTLCDPIDGSPPGSPVPGILQARTLEWVAISFSNAGK